MCGITGFIDYKNKISSTVLEDMVKSIPYRGPDDNGFEIINHNNIQIGLGQVRLSILDLSPAGHQPMHYKHLSIVFNGEIYNFTEIKDELIKLNHAFKSHSDTEVILHAYEEWGVRAVDKFIGMFALVILDKKENEIILLRDRAGVKPLYYYSNNGVFLFSSELKPFHKHPDFIKEIDLSALSIYFDFGYIPSPYCIFKNCYKLEPGHFLKYNLSKKTFKKETYWNVTDYYKKDKLKINYTEAKDEVHKLLISACNYRLVSDVPVGVFLSGGYDSTAVTAILQKNRKEKLKTFTIGFSEGNNEAPFAKENAAYLGTDHTEYYCTTKEAQDIIPQLSYYYDEPFADSSAIPTMLLSRVARKQVTVALSADGGDEIFAGYRSYPSLQRKIKELNRIPGFLKDSSKSIMHLMAKLIPKPNVSLSHKIQSFANALNTDNGQQTIDLFRLMNSLPEDYKKSIFRDKITDYTHGYFQNSTGYREDIDAVLTADYKMYLENDILTKVDRATMSVSLEGREPLLDHRLIQFAAQLPLEFKLSSNTGKRILKDITHEYIPQSMMDRPKSGFSLPINSWLKNELSYLLDTFLDRKSLDETGLFNTDFILENVASFKKGSLHYTQIIWRLLMFQTWYRQWM